LTWLVTLAALPQVFTGPNIFSCAEEKGCAQKNTLCKRLTQNTKRVAQWPNSHLDWVSLDCLVITIDSHSVVEVFYEATGQHTLPPTPFRLGQASASLKSISFPPLSNRTKRPSFFNTLFLASAVDFISDFA